MFKRFFKKFNAKVSAAKGRVLSDEERFIIAHEPKSIRDIEYWSQEYDRLRHARKPFGMGI
jgi:hypothetical protein